jgi:predicted nucleotidyltransferase
MKSRESARAEHEQAGESAEIQATMADAHMRHQLVSQLRQALPDLLEGLPVRLAYLFGSAATGRVTSFSDVDLALVVDRELSPRERLNLILRLQLDLADVCDIRNADVRIINDAPLVFQGKVVCEGVLVFCRAEQERIAFEVGTRLRYFDYLPVHRDLQDALFSDLREHGLHG